MAQYPRQVKLFLLQLAAWGLRSKGAIGSRYPRKGPDVWSAGGIRGGVVRVELVGAGYEMDQVMVQPTGQPGKNPKQDVCHGR